MQARAKKNINLFKVGHMSEYTTDLSNLQQDTNINLISFFEFMQELGDKQRRIVWTFHDLYFKYDHLFFGQEKLASVIPCCREHINRTISLLCKKGLIKKRRRRRMTNVYQLHPILQDPLLKKKYQEIRNQTGDVTSKVTSRIPLEIPPDKPSGVIKTPPPNLPQVEIRNTNASIKEVFRDFDIPHKDKVAFSRYSDSEIEMAFDQLANFIEKRGNPDNFVRFLQAKLDLARKGLLSPSSVSYPHHLKVLNFDDKNTSSFVKYSEADFINGYEEFLRYKQRYKLKNEVAMLHSLIKKRKNTHVA